MYPFFSPSFEASLGKHRWEEEEEEEKEEEGDKIPFPSIIFRQDEKRKQQKMGNWTSALSGGLVNIPLKKRPRVAFCSHFLLFFQKENCTSPCINSQPCGSHPLVQSGNFATMKKKQEEEK